MKRTVDLVIVGAGAAATSAAIDAVRRGVRVLIVIGTRDAGLARRLRRSLRSTGPPAGREAVVVTGAEVACVDGVNGIEAVVVRDVRTGRLTGFNATSFLDYRAQAREPD